MTEKVIAGCTVYCSTGDLEKVESRLYALIAQMQAEGIRVDIDGDFDYHQVEEGDGYDTW